MSSPIMSRSDSLFLGLKTLREMLNATPLGYVNAILSTAVIIVEARQAIKETDKDLRRLAEKVTETAIACSRLLSSSASSESQDIQLYSGIFINSLENIATSINSIPRRGLIARITGKSAKAKTLRELEQQLEQSSALLLFHMQAENVQMSRILAEESKNRHLEFQDVIAAAQKKQLDLIRARMVEASEKRCKERSTYSHYPPPSPHYFYGREDYVQHLVDCFQTIPSYQAILGLGGMGKTSLSLRVFHDPRITAIYGKNRYFLSCESIQDADSLAASLAAIFDLQQKNIVSQLKRVCSIIGINVLFLLDNFDTPWERRETRQGVETLLCHLSAIPNVSILITLRGGERPAGVPWSRPFLPPILPLSLEASKQLFMSISDVEESDPCLEQLITAVEGVPLAVTLLASQAQTSSCSELLSAWDEQKTSMVTRGFDGRLSSLDTSIHLSITSARMIAVDSALPTLQILSLLPDGATTDELALMNPGQCGTPHGSTTLRKVSLAYVAEDRRMRVLSPIREYVKSNYPPDQDLFERVFEYYEKASHYAADVEESSDWKVMVESLAPCIGNIHSILFEALLRDSLVFRGIQAAVDVVAFHRCAFVGSLGSLLNACLACAESFKFRRLEADCHLRLAVVNAASPESGRNYATAISIYRELGETELLARALCRSAVSDISGFQFSLAERHLTEAAEILTMDSHVNDRLLFSMESARMFAMTARESLAQKHFDDALLLLDSQRNPSMAMSLYAYLCAYYNHLDKFKCSVKAGRSALAVPGAADHWKILHPLQNMGLALFELGRISEAVEAYELSFEIALRYGREYDMAWAKFFLLITCLACGSLDEAETHLHGAWSLLQSTGEEALKFRLISQLGQLELLRHNYTTANAHLNEAKRMGQNIGASGPTALSFYLVPKAILCSRTGNGTSSKIYSVCSTVAYSKWEAKGETGTSLLVLGDAYILDVDSDAVTARSCYEVAIGLFRDIGHQRSMAKALVRLAVVDRLGPESHLKSAITVGRLNEAARIFQEIDHYPGAKYCSEQLKEIETNERMDVSSLLALPYAHL